MRKIQRAFIQRLGGTEPLELLYDEIRRLWTTSGLFYRNEGLADGHGLTAVRHDQLNSLLQKMCESHPGWFPAFEPDRRRARVFALVETSGLIFSAAIARSRAEWFDAAGSRVSANPQTSLFCPPVEGVPPIVALLMVINGRPRIGRIRERPREIVVKFLQGDKYYSSSDLSLDGYFSRRKTNQPTIAPAAIHLPNLRPAIKQEAIDRKRIVRLKTSISADKDDK